MPEAKKILIVDDDQDIIDGASIRLKAAGFDTISAKDGEAGVAKAVETSPDVILLDVRMPRMDGLMALEHLQDNEGTKHIPIVMLSASLVDQQAALDAGARFFISKPYNGKQLVAIMNAALTNQTNRSEDETAPIHAE